MFAYLLAWVSFPSIDGILKKIYWKWQWKPTMTNVKFGWFSPQIYLHWIATIIHFVIDLIEYYDFVSAAVFNKNKTCNCKCVLKKSLQPQSIDRNRSNDLEREPHARGNRNLVVLICDMAISPIDSMCSLEPHIPIQWSSVVYQFIALIDKQNIYKRKNKL